MKKIGLCFLLLFLVSCGKKSEQLSVSGASQLDLPVNTSNGGLCTQKIHEEVHAFNQYCDAKDERFSLNPERCISQGILIVDLLCLT